MQILVVDETKVQLARERRPNRNKGTHLCRAQAKWGEWSVGGDKLFCEERKRIYRDKESVPFCFEPLEGVIKSEWREMDYNTLQWTKDHVQSYVAEVKTAMLNQKKEAQLRREQERADEEELGNSGITTTQARERALEREAKKANEAKPMDVEKLPLLIFIEADEYQRLRMPAWKREQLKEVHALLRVLSYNPGSRGGRSVLAYLAKPRPKFPRAVEKWINSTGFWQFMRECDPGWSFGGFKKGRRDFGRMFYLVAGLKAGLKVNMPPKPVPVTLSGALTRAELYDQEAVHNRRLQMYILEQVHRGKEPEPKIPAYDEDRACGNPTQWNYRLPVVTRVAGSSSTSGRIVKASLWIRIFTTPRRRSKRIGGGSTPRSTISKRSLKRQEERSLMSREESPDGRKSSTVLSSMPCTRFWRPL